MKNGNFYNSIAYQERQAEITKKNWQKGIYDFLRKRERKQCARIGCGRIFDVKASDSKKFCSRSCAMKVNNSKRSKVNSCARKKIEVLYKRGFSMAEISQKLGYGNSTVVYWMKKLRIPRRNISDAVYQRLNPQGDPFDIKKTLTLKDQKLLGLGIGLYWGEGNKTSKTAVRLGNSDPKLIKLFREFLIKICRVKQERLKYNLLLFNDADKRKAINFWTKELGLAVDQIGSVTSLKPRGKGTYKKKSMTGVLLIEFNNTKLKKEMDRMIEILS